MMYNILCFRDTTKWFTICKCDVPFIVIIKYWYIPFVLQYILVAYLFYTYSFAPLNLLSLPLPSPLLFSPVTTASLFSVSVSLLHLPSLFYFLILHINSIIQHLPSSLSHISVNIMPSNQSMFLKMAKVHSFLWLSKIPLCVCVDLLELVGFFFFICSSNLK